MKLKKRYSFSSLATLLITSAVLLFSIVIFFVFVTLYQKEMEKNAIVNTEQAVAQAGAAVTNYTEEMLTTMRLFRDVYKNGLPVDGSKIAAYMELNPAVVVVGCYDREGNLLDSVAKGKRKENPLKDLSYLGWDVYSDGQIHISKPHTESLVENEYPWVVSIAQNIKTAQNQEITVVLDIQFSGVAKYIDNVGIGQHGYCFITDDAGNIVYHPQQQLLYSGVKQENTALISSGKKGSFVQEQKIYHLLQLNNSHWQIVGVSYTEELVTANVRSLIFVLLLLFAIVIVTAVVCGTLLSRTISKPINSLINAMREFEKNTENFSYKVTRGSNEVMALSESFAQMVKRIQELMEKVRNEEITLRKTELKALQAQINPHFLYNTLDAISWLCEEERNKDAAQMVNALAKLFRISISKGHELIPIQKEVEHAKSYLMIENFRYKNQFTYRFDVQSSCLSYLCNKITLQPIIENAIYHGLNRMVDEGEIVVRIFEDGEDIVFTVEDNGVGMTAEQCTAILKKEPGDKAGIGIKNVNDRIKIYFGDKYGLTIDSALDEGTRVTIRMPKVEGE